MKSRKFFILAACVLAGAGTVVGAETDTNFSGAIWALSDTKQVMAAAAEITPEKYPNCDQATVERKLEEIYRADGTGLSQDETFIKALTEKGKRNNRQISLSFMLPYSRCEVSLLEVIKPDGTVVPVDIAGNSKESIDDSQMSANIYDPNDRVLRVNLPDVEVGDVIHSVARQTILRAIMPGQFADEEMLEDPSYIRHEWLEVRGPADCPLQKIAIRDEVPGTVTSTNYAAADGERVYHWEVNNVPRMFDEPAMPPYDQVLQRLLVSTTPDWQAISKWYWNLSQPHLEATSPEMLAEIKTLTANDKTDVEKAKSIFYYVSKNIRYMGNTPETNRPGFEPHDVKITFDKKYGVCRDKAGLLVSMLRNAGFKSYPVLINIGAKRDKEVASPDFNHAIVSVQFTNGQYVLMDPTDEHTKDFLPADDCNRSFLVCRAEGEDLRTSAIQPAEQHMMKIKTTGTLTASGELEAKSELEFDGVNDDEYRNAFSHMKPDDRRRFFERDLKAMMPGAELKSLKITPEDMLDTSKTLRAELEFSAEGMTANGNGKSIVSVPWIGNRLGIVNFILGGAGLEQRKYPMQTFVACGLDESVALKLEGGFRGAVSLPDVPEENDDCSLYRETFSAKEDELDCAREMKLKVVEFSPAQYLTLKKELKDLEYDARKAPLMAVSESAQVDPAPKFDPVANLTVSSDAEILDSHKEIDVVDAHTVTLKSGYSKKILTYAGKIREAEFKIGFNPSCQTAKLVRGVVIGKDGARQEVSPGETHVMDAGWNASAKRYTGGKILVANLPGVDIGSTIEVEYEITSTNRPFVSGYESFHLPDGLDHKKVVLTAPAGLAIHQYMSGPSGVIKADAKNDAEGQRYTWEAEHVAAEANEGQTPPSWAYNEGVSFFAGDMKAYLSALNDMMLNRSEKREKVAEQTRDITKDAKTDLEKAQAIRDYVAKTVRYAGPGFAELPLSELSAADTTLTDGYGHAADRAILLHAMFSAAGFKPQFVLASGLPPISGITNVADTFPLPEWFQDPLVKVEIDGVNYYFNDTDQYAKLGAAPTDGKLGLDLATQTMEQIKAAPGCANKIETTYTLAASDNGRTRITVSRRYFGEDYGWKHKYFAELPPEERHRYFQEEVSGVSQGARPVGDLITQFDSYPGLEQFTVDVDNYSVVDGKYCYFELPFTPSLYGTGADQRTLPLFFSGRNENTVRTEIQLPPSFPHVVMAPASLSLDGPDGSGIARITATDTPGKCVLTDYFETEPSIIDPKDYPEMLKLEASLGRKASRVFLLERD